MLSLIIATFNDNGALRACLASLARQVGAPSFEVLIVDQNADDRVANSVAEFSRLVDIRHLRVAFRGACRARNHGARLARGEWLAFPDDDCELGADTLAQFHNVRTQNPDLRIVTGRTVDQTGAPNLLRWATVAYRFDPYAMFRCVTEATLFAERQAFLSVGGFDERFGPGTRFPAAEGIDLVNRVFSAFGPDCAYYTPLIAMQHPTKIPPFNRWAAGRFHTYAIGDGALIAKSPQPHMLKWGARTILSAGLQTFSLPFWRGASYAARLAGLLRGIVRYHLDTLRGR